MKNFSSISTDRADAAAPVIITVGPKKLSRLPACWLRVCSSHDVETTSPGVLDAVKERVEIKI
jgi:hypothetical protein